MKQRDLIRILKQYGWSITEGTRHDMAIHPAFPGKKIPIPRHNEINEWTSREILKEAGINLF